VQALSEALAITSAYSVDPNTLIQAVASNACGSMVAKLKLPNMATGDYDPHFSLDNMLKDSKFAIQAAKQKNLVTPGIETTSKMMQQLSDSGNGNLDFSSLYKQFSK